MEMQPFASDAGLLDRLLYLIEGRRVETLGDLMRFTSLAGSPVWTQLQLRRRGEVEPAPESHRTGREPLTADPAASPSPARSGTRLPVPHPPRTSPAQG